MLRKNMTLVFRKEFITFELTGLRIKEKTL